MTKRWIKLNDAHINIAAHTTDFTDQQTIITALVNLYNVPSIVEQDDDWEE